MMRKLFMVIGVILLITSVSSAGSNRDRDLPGGTTAVVDIGLPCEPETDLTALGWDQTPTSGSWGGLDESKFAVVWAPGFVDAPTLAGRMAQCTIPGVSTKTPQEVQIRALEGLANDSYCVFASVAAGDLLVGCKTNTTSGSENWKTDIFYLPANAFMSGQDVTIKILATGNSWPAFSTWGQLGVDWILIRGS